MTSPDLGYTRVVRSYALRPLLVFNVVLGLALTGVAACGDSSSDEDAGAADGGTDGAVPGADANVRVDGGADATTSDAGNGSEGGTNHDASADALADADTDADAAAPDAGPVGTVTVVVVDRTAEPGTPVSGVTVLFHDTTGAILRATSDATGKASAELHEGASITAIRRYDATFVQITSVLGVSLGDTIDVGDDGLLFPEATKLNLNAAMPPGFPAGTQYRFFDGRGMTVGSATPNDTAASGGDSAFVDGDALRLIGMAPAPFGQVYTPTKYAVVSIPKLADAGPGTGNVVTGDWKDVETGTLSLTGAAPAAATSWTWALLYANRRGYYPLLSYNVATPTLPATFSRLPPAAVEHELVESSLVFAKSTSSHVRRFANAASISEDLGGYLPAITGASVSGAVAGPTVTATTASATTASIGYASLSGVKTVDAGEVETNWRVLHRRTSDAVTLPAIPADLADALPASWAEVSRLAHFDSAEVPWSVAHTDVSRQERRNNVWRYAYPATPFEARVVVYRP